MRPCKVCNLETDCEHREPDWDKVRERILNTSGRPEVKYVSYQQMKMWKDCYNAGLERAVKIALSNRYTEEDGIDQEMKCYNDGREEAAEEIRQENREGKPLSEILEKTEAELLIPVTIVSKDEAKEMFGRPIVKRNPELEKPVITMYEWMYERDKKDAYNAGLRRAVEIGDRLLLEGKLTIESLLVAIEVELHDRGRVSKQNQWDKL